jgi:putative transposase
MPRRPRILLDDVPLHVVQRGHNREPCFFAEEDFHTYLHWLQEALRENEVALHAFVLMTNHVHLLLTPRHAERVPRLVISLGRRYVQYINRTYRRTGTLWDSRYGVKGPGSISRPFEPPSRLCKAWTGRTVPRDQTPRATQS